MHKNQKIKIQKNKKMKNGAHKKEGNKNSEHGRIGFMTGVVLTHIMKHIIYSLSYLYLVACCFMCNLRIYRQPCAVFV
ncbi:MAG: hypothetical protein A7316_01320 [Candidatus Altiarchaeales archaeon WOR_SM1_86-2]|nr:MAG: hypothetical protein A7316_01320 [Candidatus Altiarchaeales archaeon WOR_SM1_86-2]